MTDSTALAGVPLLDWSDEVLAGVRCRSTGTGDVLLVVVAPADTVSPALEQLAAAALWAAVDNPGLVSTLVLEAPTVFAPAVPVDDVPVDDVPVDDVPTDAVPLDGGLVDAMPQCEVPTLVLLGQRDPVAPPEVAGDYKRLPASSVAIVYAAGADISGERPAAFVATVSDYVRRGQAFVLSTASTLIHA